MRITNKELDYLLKKERESGKGIISKGKGYDFQHVIERSRYLNNPVESE